MKNKIQLSRLNGPSTDSIFLAAIQLVTTLTSLVSTKLLAISLSLNNYATYSSILLVVSITTSFTLLGLGDCVNYFYNHKSICKNDEDRLSYINTIFLIQCFVGIIAGLILIFCKGSISDYFSNPAISAILLIVSFKPLLENTLHLHQVLFVSIGKARLIAVRNLIISLLRIAIIYISIRIYSDITLIFKLLVFIDLIQIVIYNLLFWKNKIRINLLTGSLKKITEILSYGFPMGIFFMTNTMMREIDKLIIGRLSSQNTYAIYYNCSKELPLNVLVTAMATVLIPYIMQLVSQKDYKSTINLFKDYLKVGYLSVWMFSCAIIITAQEMISFLYSDEYIVGIVVFILYIVVIMIRFGSMHLILAADGKSKLLMLLSFASLIINVLLNVIFYYVFDIFGYAMVGPAVSTLVVTFIYTAVLLKLSVNVLRTSIKDVLDLRNIILYFIQLFVTGIIFFFAKQIMLMFGMNRFIAMIIICVLYCGVNALLRIKEYKALFKSINQFRGLLTYKGE